MRLYAYVGPPATAERVADSPGGDVIASPAEMSRWLGNRRGRIVATFVVDAAGRLRLTDRHSEHVACAQGQPVLAAGEITLWVEGEAVEVEAVSNQSTGYCPEPESWPAVAGALVAAGLQPPEGYSPALLFRRCLECAAINIVKDGVYECAICSGELPAEWNIGE